MAIMYHVCSLHCSHRDSERETCNGQETIQEPSEKVARSEMTIKCLRNIIAYCILPPKGRPFLLLLYFLESPFCKLALSLETCLLPF